MAGRTEAARRAGGPSGIAAHCSVLGLITLFGCSSYDPGRLGDEAEEAGRGSSGAGGAHGGSGGTGGGAGRGGSGAGGAGGTGGTSGVTAFDGGDGVELDASDPFVPGTDAGLDAGAQPDAGCSASSSGSDDCCPDDDAKIDPGQCGCGNADDDRDDDGTADCVDECPDDAMKTAPGICGCGRLDSDQGGVTSCAGLVSALLHRYLFDGSG
jgi:hypothetical protein